MSEAVQTAGQCDPQAPGEEDDEDVGFDAPFVAMEDRVDCEVAFEALERLLHRDKLKGAPMAGVPPFFRQRQKGREAEFTGKLGVGDGRLRASPRAADLRGVRTERSARLFGLPRWAWILAALALIPFAIVAIRPLREPVMRVAGWALVVNESVVPADIIVLSLDSGGAGALEAADLVHRGIAKRVAVFGDPPRGEDYEFIRRGLPYEDAGARQIRQLKMLGVTDVVQISRVDGTQGEGRVLPQWCDEQHLRSIVVVATKDHSRRLRRVLDRVMKGHPTQVTVHTARYSSFDPDRWWETREGIRTEIVELQKLLLDVVLHPMSN